MKKVFQSFKFASRYSLIIFFGLLILISVFSLFRIYVLDKYEPKFDKAGTFQLEVIVFTTLYAIQMITNLIMGTFLSYFKKVAIFPGTFIVLALLFTLNIVVYFFANHILFAMFLFVLPVLASFILVIPFKMKSNSLTKHSS